MSKTIIQTSRDKWLPSEIAGLNRRLKESKFIQPPTVSRLPSIFETTKTIPTATIYDFLAIATTPLLGQTLIPNSMISIYKNSVSSDNKYPVGANWSSADLLNFHFWTWIDSDSSSGKDFLTFLYFENYTGSDLDLIIHYNTAFFEYTNS